MSVLATIRIAPLLSKEVLASPLEFRRLDRVYYQRNGFRLDVGAPVLVDHDVNRKIGVVRELVEWDDIDGEWLVARCKIIDPPCWLKAKRTKASFEVYHDKDKPPRKRGELLELRGDLLVTEVSILSPNVKPADPDAGVVLLREMEDPPAVVRQSSSPIAGGVILPRGGDRILQRPSSMIIGIR